MKPALDLDAVHLQLVSALEHERVAVAVMRSALLHAGAASRWLRWKAVLEEAQRGEQALLAILHDLGFDPERDSAPRRAVRDVGQALLHTLRQVRRERAPRAAEECVRLVERRERGQWELLGPLLRPQTRRASPCPPRARHAAVHDNAWLERAAQFRLQRPAPEVAAAG